MMGGVQWEQDFSESQGGRQVDHAALLPCSESGWVRPWLDDEDMPARTTRIVASDKASERHVL